jgi:TATA-box binding protein (TBP) (component of TFIID and TFIIIB)
MNKTNHDIVTKFNDTGDCEINIDNVVKYWNNKFSISKFDNKYTLLIKGRGKENYNLKVQISARDAGGIINELNLIGVQSAIFTSGKTYITLADAEKEMHRLIELSNERIKIIELLNRNIILYQEAILTTV